MVRTSFLTAFLGTALLAQAIPPRPEAIAFKPLAFSVPRAGSFKTRLANGIPVYYAEDPVGVSFVRIKVMVKGGSYLDPAGKEGLATLMGSQLRDGGTQKVSASDLDERLEFLAGNITSDFGATSGTVSMTILEKDLKEGLDLFMQVLTQPAFAQERLDRAKDGFRQMMASRNDAVGTIAQAELARLLYGPSHFLSVQPTTDSLASLSREDLAACHARLLHPKNLVVSVSGRLKRKDMLELLQKTLGRIPAGPAAQASPAVPVPAHRPRPGIYVVDKDVPQSLVQFALPGLRRTDPDWHAAVVLNQVLGGSGFTCRLMKKIRSDEGLTYGIGTQFTDGAFWTGLWKGSFQTKNLSVPFALRLLLAEVERIKSEPVPAEELASIKAAIIEAFPSEWGKKPVVVDTLAKEQVQGWPEDWWVDFRDRIQAVTAGDVQRVARQYLDPSRLTILVVGKAVDAEAGDAKDHPGLLKDVAPLPLTRLPLRDPLTLKPLP
ncbi:MAG: insulinase family protein [Geothrix sp.]|uniref:M16 family metallopeptidase n=1 Tax=Geothrix sp. TaxID=1962974 RepID=UPI00180B4CB2|nr:pitrilysin family protein [Geothrix sp.]NWJ42501.1 insulinase family protein [Geothrix sp.]WIL19537.1 MAG: insulinase family protein [Geothrix sp.]